MRLQRPSAAFLFILHVFSIEVVNFHFLDLFRQHESFYTFSQSVNEKGPFKRQVVFSAYHIATEYTS